jgi:hypothetical protein
MSDHHGRSALTFWDLPSQNEATSVPQARFIARTENQVFDAAMSEFRSTQKLGRAA